MDTRKYYMTVKNTETGELKEEELKAVMITEKSPHFPFYEEGLNDIPDDVTDVQLDHYARNLVSWFNYAAGPRKALLEFVSSRIEF